MEKNMWLPKYFPTHPNVSTYILWLHQSPTFMEKVNVEETNVDVVKKFTFARKLAI